MKDGAVVSASGSGRRPLGTPARWAELEVLTRAAAAKRVRSLAGLFYVYVLLDPDGTPFYVGKGKGERLFQHEADAHNTRRVSHKLNMIRRLWRDGAEVHYALHTVAAEEARAHAAERDLIAWYGRHDLGLGPLTNQLDGGEGAANPSAAVQARHAASLGGEADDPERRTVNRFLASIAGRQSSVPIKPWNVLRPTAHLLRPSPKKVVRNPSERMAKALTAAAAAQEKVLMEGAVLARLFVLDGIRCALENGCGGDMIAAGLITPVEPRLHAEEEAFQVTAQGVAAVRSWIGDDRLVDLGVLLP